MTQAYTPIYKNGNETPLKEYYTFVGAGFYKGPKPTDSIVFKWDNKAAWEEILYRHLYTTDQRNQLHAYLQIVSKINTIGDDVRKDIKDGRFRVVNSNYCVRNMYIYSREIVEKWLGICAIHFRRTYMDTLAYAISVLCKNGGHTIRDILTIIQYATTYTITGIVAAPVDVVDKYYVYNINDTEYIFPTRYYKVAEILEKYFNIKCNIYDCQPMNDKSLNLSAYSRNNNGFTNPTGICTALSLLYLLSDIDILVQECDAYDGIEDSIMYMFKTFQEFRRDATKLYGHNKDRNNPYEFADMVHRKYGKLYHCMDVFLYEEWAVLRLLYGPNRYTPKKVIEVARPLPYMYGWGATDIPIIKVTDSLVAQLKYPMTMILDGKCDTKTRSFIYDISPGKELDWLKLVDTSTKYVVLRRAISAAWFMWFTYFNAANLPIRIYNKDTDSDYVLVSYIMHIPCGFYWHAVYVNMETRTRTCNSVTDDGPSAMYSQTTDNIGATSGTCMDVPDYTPQSLAHACMILYRLDDGPSQVIK